MFSSEPVSATWATKRPAQIKPGEFILKEGVAWSVNLDFFKKKASHLVGQWVQGEELCSVVSGCWCHLQSLSVATRKFPTLGKKNDPFIAEEGPDASASGPEPAGHIYTP